MTIIQCRTSILGLSRTAYFIRFNILRCTTHENHKNKREKNLHTHTHAHVYYQCIWLFGMDACDGNILRICCLHVHSIRHRCYSAAYCIEHWILAAWISSPPLPFSSFLSFCCLLTFSQMDCTGNRDCDFVSCVILCRQDQSGIGATSWYALTCLRVSELYQTFNTKSER